jgi:proline iminopeptidase
MPSYPEIEPYGSGLLDTGDGNLVYWETCGNPDGVPALIVHGGPGSGCTTGNRRSFDPQKFRIILFDQRNCGRSLPHASDPSADMALNTTGRLLTDMEQLREHLGVDKWLLRGGSWGVTLSLAYAQRYPARVSGMLMLSVTSTRRLEIDWLYRGAGRFFPEAWARFRDFAGLAGTYRLPTDATPPVSGLLQAYSRMMEDPDIGIRSRAATEWLAWEDAVISQESSGSPGTYSDRPDDAKLALVRICSHYFAHDGFLEDGVLIREAGRLAGIPGVMIHGRNDLSGGACTAWELARAWPGAELIIVDDSGHTGSTTMTEQMHAAAGRLYQQITNPPGARLSLSAVPRRDADGDRARVNLDAQFLAGRARAAIEFVADLLAELDSELLSLRDLDEGGHGGLAASEPGERPGPLDRVLGRHHPELEAPVVRSRLGEGLDPAEYLADVRGQHARDLALEERGAIHLHGRLHRTRGQVPGPGGEVGRAAELGLGAPVGAGDHPRVEAGA